MIQERAGSEHSLNITSRQPVQAGVTGNHMSDAEVVLGLLNEFLNPDNDRRGAAEARFVELENQQMERVIQILVTLVSSESHWQEFGLAMQQAIIKLKPYITGKFVAMNLSCSVDVLAMVRTHVLKLSVAAFVPVQVRDMICDFLNEAAVVLLFEERLPRWPELLQHFAGIVSQVEFRVAALKFFADSVIPYRSFYQGASEVICSCFRFLEVMSEDPVLRCWSLNFCIACGVEFARSVQFLRIVDSLPDREFAVTMGYVSSLINCHYKEMLQDEFQLWTMELMKRAARDSGRDDLFSIRCMHVFLEHVLKFIGVLRVFEAEIEACMGVILSFLSDPGGHPELYDEGFEVIEALANYTGSVVVSEYFQKLAEESNNANVFVSSCLWCQMNSVNIVMPRALEYIQSSSEVVRRNGCYIIQRVVENNKDDIGDDEYQNIGKMLLHLFSCSKDPEFLKTFQKWCENANNAILGNFSTSIVELLEHCPCEATIESFASLCSAFPVELHDVCARLIQEWQRRCAAEPDWFLFILPALPGIAKSVGGDIFVHFLRQTSTCFLDDLGVFGDKYMIQTLQSLSCDDAREFLAPIIAHLAPMLKVEPARIGEQVHTIPKCLAILNKYWSAFPISNDLALPIIPLLIELNNTFQNNIPKGVIKCMTTLVRSHLSDVTALGNIVASVHATLRQSSTWNLACLCFEFYATLLDSYPSLFNESQAIDLLKEFPELALRILQQRSEEDEFFDNSEFDKADLWSLLQSICSKLLNAVSPEALASLLQSMKSIVDTNPVPDITNFFACLLVAALRKTGDLSIVATLQSLLQLKEHRQTVVTSLHGLASFFHEHPQPAEPSFALISLFVSMIPQLAQPEANYAISWTVWLIDAYKTTIPETLSILPTLIPLVPVPAGDFTRVCFLSLVSIAQFCEQSNHSDLTQQCIAACIQYLTQGLIDKDTLASQDLPAPLCETLQNL